MTKNPELAHAVSRKLGTMNLIEELYMMNWTEWRSLDTMHLLINHRAYLDEESEIKEFDEANIQTYYFTYGEMCRDILSRIKSHIGR